MNKIAIDKAIEDFGGVLSRDPFEGPLPRFNVWSVPVGRGARRFAPPDQSSEQMAHSTVTPMVPRKQMKEIINANREEEKHSEPGRPIAASEKTAPSVTTIDRARKPPQAA